MQLEVVILAAGQGTRMRSKQPKVLHPLAGKPMVSHVIHQARQLQAEVIHLVIGHGGEAVRAQVAGEAIRFVEQTEQLGTGHAVQQVLPGLADNSRVLILYGDVPLIQASTLSDLLAPVDEQHLGLLTLNKADPTGYGRILRDAQQQVCGIVEQKDASEAQKAITEVNTGVLAVTAAQLRRWLPALSNDNAQGEYYLTDILAMAYQEGVKIHAVQPQADYEVEGVNDRVQLARLERVWQQVQAEHLMRQGVTLADPARIDIRGELSCEMDVFIDVGCVFEGRVHLASGVRVGAYCVIKDTHLGEGVTLASHCVLEGARLEADNRVGPFARLRPQTCLQPGAKVGNFVEIKKSELAAGAKVNHLSYIGDAQVGAQANIGAGTITCNYDGVNKHQTQIGAGAFIGSNSSLVAPVRIGDGATVGAGSTITRSVPDQALAVSRSKQQQIADWPRPTKQPQS